MRVYYWAKGYQMAEKKDWLHEMKNWFVGVGGDDSSNLCGMTELAPCKTVGHAVDESMAQLSSTITVLCGRHVSEGATINVGGKKISVVGRGKAMSVIGMNSLSSSSTTLFSISTGQLEVGHMGIDHNATRSSSPSVFVVSLGSGTLSLEDVVIDSSTSGGSGMTKCVFEVVLSQLKMVDVEIKNMKMNQPLLTEPSSGEVESEESFLSNVTIRNVNLTEGDGVVMAKSVKAGETFVVWNTTIEGCVYENGNGGGIKVELASSTSQVRIGTSTSHNGGATTFNKTKCSGYGGGVMLYLADNSFDFAITTVSFVGCSATLGGKDVFVNESGMVSGTITTTKLNVGHNASIYDELMGYDRNEGGMGIFPLNVFLDTFRCLTVDYCANSRLSESSTEIEVVSSSSITKEITGQSFGVIISGRIAASPDGERMGVNVSDGGSVTQDWLVGCSSSLTMRRLSFVVKGQLNSRRSAFIHSTSTLSVTNCSVSFESGALTDGKIGYNVINIVGGELIVDGFVMEGGVIMNGKSPVAISNGVELEMKNSRVIGVEAIGVDVGCLNVGMGVNGNVKIEESNFSSTCSGGDQMKGGGMMMTVGKRGSLEIKNVKYSGCEVPSEDREEGGK
ncbi:uncharacterized protein MONOS_7634 [Monocercomonoides exilis]|uniref:uncharacterized protein n=1 Tax=Monocercomonoides exilis TaxID=2049356 RepID=UPI00355AA23C|nr:hypothetical protein MONOS_7634 [Monocercomonoides exilis]|eukprot:MONOS_7634.1-p1 / transcript=MONOS_7634.1 / gene=MONOS_7634 / organism=Monocercomonoides_exilis_PA203 / gene_product=unspecified product / transcript_product=unspecified product / location=Mono_scaffold00266:31936-33795(+) / protein_length=620 / sequence_SO=supercontig / SO=protein_coding / is_pseudo=false